MPEILRIVQALQMSDCSDGSIPANWMPGQPIIMPSPSTYPLLQERLNYINQNNNGMSWYLAFKEPPKICEKNIYGNSNGNSK